jgi:hypothetical protein
VNFNIDENSATYEPLSFRNTLSLGGPFFS